MSTNNNKDEEEKDLGYYLKQCGWFALKTAMVVGTGVAVAGTAILAATELVSAVGFDERGPRGNSMASRYQSANAKRGNRIEEGSLFSTLQRTGMKGMPESVQTGITVGSVATVALASIMMKK